MIQEEKDLLRPIFWDTDINNLDPKKHTRYMIERILQYGLAEHVNWMLKNYTENEIIQAVIQSRIIDRKTANLWSYTSELTKMKFYVSQSHNQR